MSKKSKKNAAVSASLISGPYMTFAVDGMSHADFNSTVISCFPGLAMRRDLDPSWAVAFGDIKLLGAFAIGSSDEHREFYIKTGRNTAVLIGGTHLYIGTKRGSKVDIRHTRMVHPINTVLMLGDWQLQGQTSAEETLDLAEEAAADAVETMKFSNKPSKKDKSKSPAKAMQKLIDKSEKRAKKAKKRHTGERVPHGQQS